MFNCTYTHVSLTHTNNKIILKRTCEMAQQVRVFSNKPDSLTSIPSTFMVERENYVLQMFSGDILFVF